MDLLVKMTMRILKMTKRRRLPGVSAGSRTTLVCPPLAATPSVASA
jgi:hypothetical protein